MILKMRWNRVRPGHKNVLICPKYFSHWPSTATVTYRTFLKGWPDFLDMPLQAFLNCVHGYDGARNVHEKGVTRTRKFVHVLIPLFKNNLHLPMCSSFFFFFFSFFFPALCLIASSSCSPCCHAHFLTAMLLFFLLVCFYGSRFCSPAIYQTSLSQSRGWFPFILQHFWQIVKLI